MASSKRQSLQHVNNQQKYQCFDMCYRNPLWCGCALIMIIYPLLTIALFLNQWTYQYEADDQRSYHHSVDTHGYPPEISGITTDEDYNWCKSILVSYHNSSNNVIFFDDFRHPQSGVLKGLSPIRFTSEHGQDWFLYNAIFRNMDESGFYVELAANHYLSLSNSFFLDKCLSWNGLCIEAVPSLIPDLRKYRNCIVIQTCVWNESYPLKFEYNEQIHQVGGIRGKNKLEVINPNRKIKTIEMNCTTLQQIANQYNVRKIDYLSLDVEGAEYQVLQGIDFERLRIDVITLENNDRKSLKYLMEKQFIPKIAIFADIVLVHKNALQKMKWIDQWLDNVDLQNPIISKSLIKRLNTDDLSYDQQ